MNKNKYQLFSGIFLASAVLFLQLSEVLGILYFIPMFLLAISLMAPNLILALIKKHDPAAVDHRLMTEARRITALSISGRENQFSFEQIIEMEQSNFIKS